MVFNVAGDGSALEAAMAHTEKQQIQNVNFLGYVMKEQKGNLLLDSHILLFPTFYGEGLPNCILESMLYGLVIVSTEVAGIPDAVKHLQNGFLSNQKIAGPYVDYLTGLISSQNRVEEISIANHTKATKNYTAANARKNLLRIYKEVDSDIYMPNTSPLPSKTTITT
jgi:glycosyltransferase involved in cell wall biosynthesis